LRERLARKIPPGTAYFGPDSGPVARSPPPAQTEYPDAAAPPASAASPAVVIPPHLAIRRYPAAAPAYSRRTRSALRFPSDRDCPPACLSRDLPVLKAAPAARSSPPTTSCRESCRASYSTPSALW